MTESVRIATESDADEVMRLLTLMHAEGGILPLDEMEARKTFDQAFQRQGGILGVIGEPGDIKAMIFLLISRFWYTKNHHLEELFNFVRPDVRKSKENYAPRLIDFARKCSDEINIPLTIGVLTNIRMEGKVRLYRRSLGVPAGAWFVHMPNGMQWQSELNEEFWKEPFPRRGRVSNGRDLRRLRAAG
jgi:hypothetical protein